MPDFNAYSVAARNPLICTRAHPGQGGPRRRAQRFAPLPPSPGSRKRRASGSTPGLPKLEPKKKKGGAPEGAPPGLFGSIRAGRICRYSKTISTRRFWGSRTPSGVGTSGSRSPFQARPISDAGTPSRTSSSRTVSARLSDSFML